MNIVPASNPLPTTLMIESAQRYIAQSKAENTLRAYRSDWNHFAAWCEGKGLSSLPARPEAIACYAAELADGAAIQNRKGEFLPAKAATITRRLAAISKAHEAAGYESPCSMRHAVVCETLKGIRRAHGTAPKGKAPLLTKHLRKMLAGIPDGPLGSRDRAILLLGFAGGFRRSELAALKIDDVQFKEDGAVITLRRSKTDQEGAGREVGVPYGSDPLTCPVRSLKRWIAAAQIYSGSLFRLVDRSGRVSDRGIAPQAVAIVCKRYCSLAGLDMAAIGAHSLRSGLVTQACLGGASERSVMAQTGHRSRAMVDRYYRKTSIFCDNAASRCGL